MSLKKCHEQEKAKREQLFRDLEHRCYQCGQTGHFKSECISQPLSSRPQERGLEPKKEDVSEKLDHIKCIRIQSVGRGNVVPVNVNNIECSGVIGIGAIEQSFSHVLQGMPDLIQVVSKRLVS